MAAAFALPPHERLLLHGAVQRAKGIYSTAPALEHSIPARQEALNTVLLTTCNSGWSDVLYSWACAARSIGLRTLLFVTNIELLAELQRPGGHWDGFNATLVPHFSLTMANKYPVGTGSASFRTPTFNRATMLKLHVTLCILRLGVNVWLSDLDIAFIRDPWPAFQLTAPCDLELFATWRPSKDRHQPTDDSRFSSFNSGYTRLRASRPTIELLEQTINLSAHRPHRDDQTLLREVFLKWIRRNRTQLLAPRPGDSRRLSQAAKSEGDRLRWVRASRNPVARYSPTLLE